MNDKILKRRELILKGSLWKAILLLAVPVAMNDMIRAAYNLVDTFFVANIGSMEVAAITFVGPINMFVRAVSMGLGVGGTSLIAREIGRGHYKKAKGIAVELLVIAIFLGLLVSGFAFSFSKEILLGASATEEILSVAVMYFKLTALSTVFVFINSAYIAIKRAEGDTLKTMRINMVGMGIKVVISYIMIFRFDMGIRGLAISTIIGTAFVSIYGLYDLFIRKSMLQLTIKGFRFTKHVLSALLLISIPIIIERTSVSFSFILMNKYVIAYGEEVLAGYGITNRVNSMFFATVTGFATGLSPIVSQNLGANDPKRARKAINITYLIAIMVSVVVIIIFLPLRVSIAEVFTKDNATVLYHTVNAMTVYSISVIPWAVFQVTNGVFQGTGNTKYNLIVSLSRIYLFRIPLVIVFSTMTTMGEYSVWFSMLLSNTLTGFLAWILYRLRFRELKLYGNVQGAKA